MLTEKQELPFYQPRQVSNHSVRPTVLDHKTIPPLFMISVYHGPGRKPAESLRETLSAIKAKSPSANLSLLQCFHRDGRLDAGQAVTVSEVSF